MISKTKMKRLLLLVLLAVSATPSVINDVNKVPDDGDAGEMADVEVNEIPEKVVWDRAELTEEFEEQLLTAVVTPRLSEGIIGPLDTLLYNATHSKPAENGVPYRNIININVVKNSQILKMNSFIFMTLVAAAAAATVVSQKVSKVVKPSDVAKAHEDSEVARTTDLANNEEVKYSYIYDEFGVPMRTLPDNLQSINVGVVGPDDRLISRVNHNVAAAQFIIQDQDVTIRGGAGTNITAVQIARVGTTMHAIPTIIAGGLGREFVTINIVGVRSGGFQYTISVYASIGCANS
ncbi:hypothetical protein PYW08_009242 [Mythimna loreyi]|uniref:Uncharacterized protein n=1 Tax=Mythimna loreyi TaxID=667449 RepID=A0ACC2QCZ8_9NEOP|nr:hypothetical protein PYW08_009242 [Mythimna loreyi]